MDELEFRRKVIATPNSKDKDLLKALEGDIKKQNFVSEMQAFDADIEKAMKVPVPEDLCARLMLNQSFDQEKMVSKTKQRWSMAIAASIAFTAAIGLSSFMYEENPYQQSVSEYALEHIYHELGHTDTVDENINLNQVNAKLASFGGQLSANIGHVYYAKFCQVAGKKSLHLVVESEQGKVTVFILPKSDKLEDWSDFSDDKYSGTTQRFTSADLIVIADKSTNGNNKALLDVQERLEQNLIWTI